MALEVVRMPEEERPRLSLPRRRKPIGSPCLRKISAYNGACRVNSSDLNDEEVVKKKLTFADQHGRMLVLVHKFRSQDAPSICKMQVMVPQAYSIKQKSNATVHPLQPIKTLEPLRTTGAPTTSVEPASPLNASETPQACPTTCTAPPAASPSPVTSKGEVPALERLMMCSTLDELEKATNWSQQELLSICVVSCSVVGCLVVGLRNACQ